MFKVNNKDTKGNVNKYLVLLFILLTLRLYPTNKYLFELTIEILMVYLLLTLDVYFTFLLIFRCWP